MHEKIDAAIEEVEKFGATPQFLVVPSQVEKEFLRGGQGTMRLYKGLPVHASQLAEKIHVF